MKKIVKISIVIKLSLSLILLSCTKKDDIGNNTTTIQEKIIVDTVFIVKTDTIKINISPLGQWNVVKTEKNNVINKSNPLKRIGIDVNLLEISRNLTDTTYQESYSIDSWDSQYFTINIGGGKKWDYYYYFDKSYFILSYFDGANHNKFYLQR